MHQSVFLRMLCYVMFMNLSYSQTLMSVLKNLICVISTLHVRTQLEVMSVTASLDLQGMVSIA